MILRNKNSGFTIIEIMIVILVISLISFSLYEMLKVASTSVASINQVIDTDSPMIPFYNQLELDITGMFGPQATAAAYLEKFKQEQKESQENKPDNKPEHKLDNKAENKQGDKKNKKGFIKDVFYVKVTDSGNLTLSFITTAGIKTLETDGALKPSAFIYRVAYIMEKDPRRPGTFRIMYRCDSNSKLLNINDILDSKFEPSYELISGIKDLKIKFTVYEFVEVKTDNKDNKNTEPEKSAPKNIILSEWQEEENFKKYKALIPAYLSISGISIDSRSKKNIEHKFDFEFKIPAYIPYL